MAAWIRVDPSGSEWIRVDPSGSEWIRVDPIERSAARLRALAPRHLVTIATLDAGSFAVAVDHCLLVGHNEICVLAYFMLADGSHLLRDISALVQMTRERHPTATITLLPGTRGVADEVLGSPASPAALPKTSGPPPP